MDGMESIDLESLDETRGIGRRTFLMGALAVGAAASGPYNYAAAARRRRIPFVKEARFKLGVASGFPRPRGITLWTHLTGIKRTSKLRLVVAKDRKFNKVVEDRLVTARKDRGYTVRTFVKPLKPNRQYYYRFLTKETKSPVGRFRTAPPLNSQQPIRIAFYSCQNYEAGFFNAQRAIANEPDLDLVICLGDYMYEYSSPGGVRLDRTGDNRDGDVQRLREYRQKYELYKRDPNLKAMHAAHPFIAVWDDHEVENNYADGRPSSAAQEGHTGGGGGLPRRVPFNVRQANGYRAFFNYMPRMRFKGDRRRIYEDYRLGKMVDLVLTDQRQYRDQQPCNDAILTPCPDTEAPRTMLGAQQKGWFVNTLERSPANWKLWGSEVMVMATRLAPGIAAHVDAWDGYGRERKEILDRIVDRNIKDVVAITGDIHTFFAGTAYTTGDESTGRAAIPEFVGGSATSSGLPEATGLSPGALALLAAANPHIDFYDFVKKGYGIVEARQNELICELKAVPHRTQSGSAQTIARYRVARGQRIPQQI